MSIEVTIVCDDCNVIGGGSYTAHQIRNELKGMGWLTGLLGGRDICSDCSESPKNDPLVTPADYGDDIK